jgi:predicted MFS family arabinose efflux permease
MTIAVAAYSVGRGSPSLAGWLLTANAIGALIGGVIFAHRPRRLAAVSLPAIVAVMAATFVPPLLTPSFGVMLVLVGASGVALPAVLTGVFTETDRVAPPGTAAEAFAWVATAFGVGSALGAAANGWLVDVAGAGGGRSTVAFVLAPIAILAAAALLRLAPRRRNHASALLVIGS